MISVIIPSRNYGRYLKACLESIKNQARKVAEIIVVDDDSSDRTGEIVKKYRSIKYFKVKYHQANKARNFGFRQSSGDLIMFFDADDRMKKDCIKRLFQGLKKNPKAAFAYSDQIEEIESNHKIIKKIRRRSFPWDYGKLKNDNYIAMPALIRRKYFKGFDEKLNRLQDWDLWLSIGKKAEGIYVPKPLFYRRFHGKGITSSANLFEADLYIRKKFDLPKMSFGKKIRIKLGEAKQNIIGDLWPSR